VDDLVTLARDVFSAIDRSDYELVASHTAENCECVAPGARLLGRDQLIGFQRSFRLAFPDMVHDVTSYVQSGSVVVAEGAFRGTHSGPFRTSEGELPPTGRKIRVPFVQIVEISDGLATSIRVYFDRVDFMTQLGVGQS
jgi:predicted ester cyclase